jgi:hypothetical protein
LGVGHSRSTKLGIPRAAAFLQPAFHARATHAAKLEAAFVHVAAGGTFHGEAAFRHSSLSLAAFKLYAAIAAKFVLWPVFRSTESTLHPGLAP